MTNEQTKAGRGWAKAKSAAIVISVWIVASLFKLIGPAIRAFRA